MDLKDYIIKLSKELGIDIIGFTDSEFFGEDLKKFLIKRKEKDYHTEFENENIDIRTNPKFLFQNAKTIITIALSYNHDIDIKSDIKYKGILSKSSWGIDYHEVLKRKLEKLALEINDIKKFNYKVFVDTGPLIDRYLANKSGIGWYGKNCSIINDEYGSFIFIGYLITDLELENSNIIEEKCGECNLCINSCPTNAIKEDYYIDFKKCISYLTQTKSKIPYDLRDKMGTKIYGCDTCQNVCPKNKGIIHSKNNEFYPNKTFGYIDIEKILKLSNKEFKEQYGHLSGSWRGKNILKRNCIITLGNMKDKNSIDILKGCLNDSSPMIREYTAWALFKVNKDMAFEITEKHLKKEKDEYVINEINNIIKYFTI